MSTASTKSGTYWRQHARRYDRATLLLDRSFARMARRAGEEVSGLCEVLEIAAGTGMVTVEIAPRVGHLVATDRSAQMLDILIPYRQDSYKTSKDFWSTRRCEPGLVSGIAP